MNLLHSTINGYIFSKFAVPRSWAQSARSQSEDVKTREGEPGLYTFIS